MLCVPMQRLRDVPQIVRWVHPDLDHSDECPYNVLPELGLVVARSCRVYGALLAFKLSDHDVDCCLVMSQRILWVFVVELCEV